MTLTAIYAALLGLLFVALSLRVIRFRRSKQISIGDNGDRDFLKLIRAHGNFAEYVPIALILIALAESQGAMPYFIHALGVLLVLGRLAHALAFLAPRMIMNLRVAGMAMTFITIISASLLNLVLAAALLRSGL